MSLETLALMQTSKGSRVSFRKSLACSIFFLRSAKLIRDLCLVALNLTEKASLASPGYIRGQGAD